MWRHTCPILVFCDECSKIVVDFLTLVKTFALFLTAVSRLLQIRFISNGFVISDRAYLLSSYLCATDVVLFGKSDFIDMSNWIECSKYLRDETQRMGTKFSYLDSVRPSDFNINVSKRDVFIKYMSQNYRQCTFLIEFEHSWNNVRNFTKFFS